MRRSVARLTAVLLGSVAVSASALGFGQMTVYSGLGQPLRARIPLQGVGGHALDGIHVAIPSTSVFHKAGVAHANYLHDIKVKVVRNGSQPYIRLRTNKPFRTPYLDLLLQIKVPGERMVREFTALINPPGAAPATASAPARGQAMHTAASTAQPAEQGGGASDSGMYGPVRHNETLWSIATRLHGSHDVTVYQMLDGLYRKNPGAFGGSINSLHAGVELRVPSDQYLQSINPQDAEQAAVRHMRTHRSANHGKLQLVATSASPQGAHGTNASESAAGSAHGNSSGLLHLSASVLASLEQRALQSTGNPFHASPLPASGQSPAGNATASSGSPAAASTAQQTGTSPVPVTASGNPASVKTGANVGAPGSTAPAARASNGGANQAGTPRATSNASGQTAGAGSHAGTAAAVTSKASTAGTPAASAGPSTAAHNGAQAPAKATATAKASPPAPKPRSSDDFLSEWSSLLQPLLSNRIALLGILLLLLLLFLVARRRRKSQKWVDTLDESLSGIETPAAEAAGETGGGVHAFVGAASTIEQATSGDDESEVAQGESEGAFDQAADAEPSRPKAPPATVADAIADAEFNMTYGLYDEALIALRQPELGYPKDRTLRLKELEVLFAAGRTDDFVSLARGLRPELARSDLSAWRRIAHMGQTLLPGDPLFNPWIEEAEPSEPPNATIGDPDEAHDPVQNTGQGGGDADNGEDNDPARAATAAVEADAKAILSSETKPDAATVQSDDTATVESDHTVESDPRQEEETHTIDFDLGDFDEGSVGSRQSSSDDTLGMPAIDFDPAAFDWSGDGDSGSDESTTEASEDHSWQPPELPDAQEEQPGAAAADDAQPAPQGAGSAPDADDWQTWGLADGADQPRQSGDADAVQGATGGATPDQGVSERPENASAVEAQTDDNAGGDDVDIKLSLARAYVEMGEKDMAQSLIDEVASQGSAIQKQQADALRELLA